jgi:signal transduction histidine kinase
MTRRSIGIPLTVGIVLTLIAVSLAVGWQILVVADLEPVTRGLTKVHWLLISLGSLFFVLIIVGLVLLCAWLVREMRVNQRQQAFLDAVTHEMKTPLASMRLFLETLGRHDLAPERRKAFLARMEEDVERLEHTVSQVLAAARAEATARRPPAGPVDLVAVLTESIEAIRDRHGLPEEAIRLEKESPVTAAGDPAELGVVFRNLLENAVRYSEPPVEVRVRLSASGEERVEVEIADQGIGIEPRELRKIFQRFYRVGRDVQRHASGLGLGLFIVGNLVRRQGGRVVARSEGSGRGSRFVVTLRAAVAAPSREALEAAPHLGSGG